MDQRQGEGSVDIEVGLRDAVAMLESKANGKDSVIDIEVEADLPRVWGVAEDLNQVWLNLLDNALDAIGPSGRVDVSAGKELDRVVVSVTDDGCGIPEDVLPRIFDPFVTTKAPGEGTGLGLEIARRLVWASDGEIEVDSRPGRTEFRVFLRPEEG